MGRLRDVRPTSELRPDGLFIRTLQGPPPNHVKLEESTGRYVVSSQAFSPSTGDSKISGDLGQLLEADGLSPTALYPTVDNALGAAAITVEAIRAAGCDVEHSPTSKNWYHGGVLGVGKNNKKQKRRLSEAAVEIVPIDQDEARRQHDAIKAENERIKAAESR